MQPIPPRFYRISVKALVLDAAREKFLLVRETKDVWDLPGGGLEWGESPRTALLREIQEEMNVPVAKIASHPSYFVTAVTKDGLWFANVLYETSLEHFNFTPSKECVEVAFVSAADCKHMNVLPNVISFAEQFDGSQHVRI